MYMSGYELNDEDIQAVLKNLRATDPDATKEDAIQLLLKTKMDVREKAQDDPEGLEKAQKLLEQQAEDSDS